MEASVTPLRRSKRFTESAQTKCSKDECGDRVSSFFEHDKEDTSSKRPRNVTKKLTQVKSSSNKKRKGEIEMHSSMEKSLEVGKRKLDGSSSVVNDNEVPDPLIEEKTVEKKTAKQKYSSSRKIKREIDLECRLIGEPLPPEEARSRWPERYNKKKNDKNYGSSAKSSSDDEVEILKARSHYSAAEVDGCIYNLNDDAYVKGIDGEADFIGRIVELFETSNGQQYFTARWFFRPEDTVIKNHVHLHDKRRLFLSPLKDPNPLHCIVSKLNIVQIAPNINLEEKERTIPTCDFYYDMSYSIEYSTFANLEAGNGNSSCESSSILSEPCLDEDEQLREAKLGCCESLVETKSSKEMRLLDLYSGCGGMSTGLCLGANLTGMNLVTRWALDLNEYACESLKLNHPETEVRNESAEDFLNLLQEWEMLCKQFSLLGSEKNNKFFKNSKEEDEETEDSYKLSQDEFEVGKILGVCFGDPNKSGKKSLHFKVRWKGYGPSDDTWEPFTGLSNCMERIQEFVTDGFYSNIFPLPGDVDVICGGPPCQGISGYNRFRNYNAPLDDPKNHQMVVFMDFVNYLKPKYVLMENVGDILKFAGGFLGRYALSRLVAMNYQARLGMMVAGCYGLPQFRIRVFMWGASPSVQLPPYPLPTHDVVVRGVVPTEFERNVVAYNEDQHPDLEPALLLGDAISDLPSITNYEERDEMPYQKQPKTDFQGFIRSCKDELMSHKSASKQNLLFDHRPLKLNEDDYQRVCRIPKKKGANFRNLPGVFVRPDNTVEWDPTVERVLLPSGKPLVPDYAMTFVKGKSTKPFGRLWWDEIVPTVVTRAEPHNQVILHPEQDRVLSVRENARLQGFPDHYKLRGPIKERYIQVGNAVAVPVARALGYTMAQAYQGLCGSEPLMTLPSKFPHCFTPGYISEVVDQRV